MKCKRCKIEIKRCDVTGGPNYIPECKGYIHVHSYVHYCHSGIAEPEEPAAVPPHNEPNHCFKHPVFNQDCDLCYEAAKKYEKEFKYQRKMTAFAAATTTPQPVVISTVFKAPAVEPQKDELLGDIRKWIKSNGSVTPSLLQRNFRIGYSRAIAAIESIEKEGLLKRVEQEKFNSFKWEWIKPEAGSTRPEMPPAEVARRIYNEVPFTISEKEWIERSSIILAASVQQEPVSAALRRLVDEVPRNSQCDEAWEQAEAALKSQPAAPRTQGREPSVAHEIPALAPKSGTRLSKSDCDYSAGWNECRQRFMDWIAAQARIQPAPKCPKCGSAEIYLYTTECIVRCPNCREVYPTLHVKDFAQFFTALPEATDEPEDKK